MTNHEKFFGTVSKARETIDTIASICDRDDSEPHCYECPIFEPCTKGNTLEWLQEEAS